jgi:WD40 repeat protein
MTKIVHKPVPPEGSELESDFQKDGVVASWAPGFPKAWGSEKWKIGDNQGSTVEGVSISHDEKLLAVAIDRKVFIFETEEFRIVETLSHTTTISHIQFSPVASGSQDVYHLLSNDNETWGSEPRKPSLVLWTLDRNGMVTTAGDLKEGYLERKVDLQEISRHASTAAISKLASMQEWTQYNSIAQRIHIGIDLILQDAALSKRIDQQWHTKGSITDFGSKAFSSDGKKICYTSTYNNQTGPQHALVVVEISTRKELWRRQDHVDSIMWAEFSPDNSFIASSAWDQYLNVYNAETGELVRSIGPSGGQNWNAAFSPVSDLIAVSRGNPSPTIFLWDIQDPQQFPSMFSGFKGWSRTMSWSPDGQMIAAGSQSCDIRVWNPHTTEASQHWRVKPGQGYQEVSDILWLKDGSRIVYKPGDGGLEIYDFKENKKWRWGPGPTDTFSRGYWASTIIVMKEKGWIGSIDQDGVLRFWDMPE